MKFIESLLPTHFDTQYIERKTLPLEKMVDLILHQDVRERNTTRTAMQTNENIIS